MILLVFKAVATLFGLVTAVAGFYCLVLAVLWMDFGYSQIGGSFDVMAEPAFGVKLQDCRPLGRVGSILLCVSLLICHCIWR